MWTPHYVHTLIAIARIITVCGSSAVVTGGSGGGGGSERLDSERATQSGTYYNDNVYRNLDTQLLRIGSRLDQLMLRMDHLDSRVGRVQSTGHLRFDSIETSMQTTRQRLDLWSNQLNLIEEQLTRKWKNMESRFDSLVTTLDSKLDAKFNLIQRDNRRHNEFISQSFSSVIISSENLSERVGGYIGQLNSTVQQTQSTVKNATSQMKTHSSVCVTNVNSLLQNITATFTQQNQQQTQTPQQQTRRNTIQPTDMLVHHRQYSFNPYYNNNATGLITSKVSNMFDELVKRSHDLEAIVKDTYTMSNATRREVQDGFMALIPIVGQVYGGGGSEKSGGGSGEVMSMVVEALSTIEQVSSSLGRRVTEMGRSINERFDIVSMTLNGFLESCLRIQERTPLIEDKIVHVLERILDSVDNSTRNATETWQKVKSELIGANPINVTNCTENLVNLNSGLQNNDTDSRGREPDLHEAGLFSLLRAYESLQQQVNEDDNNEFDGGNKPSHEDHHHRTRHHHSVDVTDTDVSELSEEQKKLMWENLRMAAGEDQVPE